MNIKMLFFIVYLCSITVPTNAEMSSVVGRIEAFDGNIAPFEMECGSSAKGKVVVVPSAYTIIREGKILSEIGFLTELHADDLVIVNDKDHLLQIRLAGIKSVETIASKNSPYRVASHGKVPTVWNNITETLLKSLTNAHQENKRTIPVSSKGGGSQPLIMPLIEVIDDQPIKVLIEGKHSLKFVWKGGKQTYKLVIKQDGKTLHEQPPATEKQIELPGSLFTRGNYQLLLSDDGEQKQEYSFSIVGKESLPTYPQELSDSALESLSEPAQLTIRAMWLSEQDNGKWLFEAYQQISDISEKYHFAKVLGDALESGVIPKAK